MSRPSTGRPQTLPDFIPTLRYRPHAGCPGHGWITPIQDDACPLVADETAQQYIAAFNTAVSDTVEFCAHQLDLSPQAIRLMAGEMTALEMRTVQAVLGGLRAKLRAHKPTEKPECAR